MQTLRAVTNYYLKSDVRLYDTEYLLMAAKFHDVARSDLFKNPVYFDEIQGISAVKKLCNMRNIGNANDLINYLTRSGYNLLQDAVKKSEKEVRWNWEVWTHIEHIITIEIKKKVASKANCVWKLAEYCDGVLRGIEEAKELEEDSKLNADKHAKSAEVIICIARLWKSLSRFVTWSRLTWIPINMLE